MDEQTAKTKWCPFVRHNTPINEGSGSFNRGVEGNPANLGDCKEYFCNCIASSCMMWRWAGGNAERGIGNEQGYCGLGGSL